MTLLFGKQRTKKYNRIKKCVQTRLEGGQKLSRIGKVALWAILTYTMATF